VEKGACCKGGPGGLYLLKVEGKYPSIEAEGLLQMQKEEAGERGGRKGLHRGRRV